MCILFIAVERHPKYPLIIAANRDEMHARPSAPVHFWRDRRGILAGRDRVAGGAWFGVNRGGRVAGITNYRGAPAKTDARSRGELVARFLGGDDSRAGFEEFLRREHRAYNPFHLIYGGIGDGGLRCFSSADGRARPLARGFHSIGNGALDDAWPKMSRGVEMLRRHIDEDDLAAGALARTMRDQTQFDGAPPREKHLSSIFILGAQYGTRATTLLFGARGGFGLHEYRYAPDGAESGRAHFSLDIPRAPRGIQSGQAARAAT
ncbi:MAG: NRDE family protein [Gammaproteobacteria bacterium]|nr:NRDE family protein [Gammaproteobacteria bacterium]